jgi:hypothetical protein
VSTFEGQLWTMREEKYLKGTAAMADPYDADSNEDDPEVIAIEWTWGKAPISYPWVKEMESTYDFDIKKVNKIFDLLPKKKQLKLHANHVIPSAGELKRKKYCKFHNATNHNMNECKIFRLNSQKAIEQGKIKFEPAKKPTMDIDGHPFLGVHMVEF